MIRMLVCAAAAAATVLCAVPGHAATNVTFSGTLGLSCTLTLTTPGTLKLSADGTTLGSEQSGGVPAVLSIISVGTNTVTVAAPTLTSSPGGYDPTGQQLEVSYSGLSGLSGVNQSFTPDSSNFPVSVVAALQVHNHVINTHGFATGTYTTQTVVTCAG